MLRRLTRPSKLDRRRARSRAEHRARRIRARAFGALSGQPSEWGPGAEGETRTWNGVEYRWRSDGAFGFRRRDGRPFNGWAVEVQAVKAAAQLSGTVIRVQAADAPERWKYRERP